jgi:hypothetical protein
VIGILSGHENRTWTYDLLQDNPISLSVSADGRTVAFPMFPGISNEQHPVIYMLNTASTARTTLGASRILADGAFDSAVFGSDGRTIDAHRGNQIVRLDTSGKDLVVVGHTALDWQPGAVGCNLSLDATGRFMLTQCGGPGAYTINGLDLKTGTTISLPFPSYNITADQAPSGTVAW